MYQSFAYLSFVDYKLLRPQLFSRKRKRVWKFHENKNTCMKWLTVHFDELWQDFTILALSPFSLPIRPDNLVKIFHLAASTVAFPSPTHACAWIMINGFLVSDSGIIFTNRRSGSSPSRKARAREGESARVSAWKKKEMSSREEDGCSGRSRWNEK